MEMLEALLGKFRMNPPKRYDQEGECAFKNKSKRERRQSLQGSIDPGDRPKQYSNFKKRICHGREKGSGVRGSSNSIFKTA